MSNVAITCIIDDDEVFVYAMKRLISLKNLSKETLVFNQVEGALQYFQDHQTSPAYLPDIVLLDINLPGLDGWEFIKQFKELKVKMAKQPRIYILSSSVIQSDKQKALNNVDVAGFFDKPLSKADFETVFGLEKS